jgi:predicted MFS family arabinose efflux permease
MRLSRKQSGYEDKMTVSERSRWLILLVVSSALFLIVIDMTVLYTALPSLARDLGTSASEKLWIINGYALVVAGPVSARWGIASATSECSSLG